MTEKTCATCLKKEDAEESIYFSCPEWKVVFSNTLINQLNCEGTDIKWRGK